MADIRIKDLPSGVPNANKRLAMDLTTTESATIKDIVYAGRPAASQAEAEAGDNSEKAMTPLTTKQAIFALAGTAFASVEQGELAETALQSEDAALVATTGDSDDLTQGTVNLLLTASERTQLAAIPAEVAVKVLEFDARMTQFAGGVKINGIDDDAPALRAIADFSKTLGTQYSGGKAVFRLPRGVLRIDSVGSGGEGVDVTDCHGIAFRGEGRPSTHIQSSINAPIIRGKNVATTSSLNYPEFSGFTIRGPGASNVNAHGLDIGSPFNGLIDVRIWGCRDAIRISNSWQTTLDDIRLDGTAANANYNGLVQTDGSLTVAENAVLLLGGVIQGCQNYGWRGECVTGSKAFGLEIVGIGAIGCYFGDSPGGKDLKWFSWSGGLIDTCPQLLVATKGSSTVAERMHWSGMWEGYASAGSGNGISVRFQGLKDCSFDGDMMPNCDMAFNAIDCDRVSMKSSVISGYDRSLVGQRAAVINNTSNSRFDYGTCSKSVGSPSTRTFEETGTSSNNEHFGNIDAFPFTISGNRSTFTGHASYASGARLWPSPRPALTKAQLATMTQAQYLDTEVICTDEVGGRVPAFFDGTNWRRVTDRAIVS